MEKIKLPKSKDNRGYTRQEILDMIRPLKIHHRTFWKKFGRNTCAYDPKTNTVFYYECDVITAIRCCLEKRNKFSWEWD